jgi:hypothetical protein
MRQTVEGETMMDERDIMVRERTCMCPVAPPPPPKSLTLMLATARFPETMESLEHSMQATYS